MILLSPFLVEKKERRSSQLWETRLAFKPVFSSSPPTRSPLVPCDLAAAHNTLSSLPLEFPKWSSEEDPEPDDELCFDPSPSFYCRCRMGRRQSQIQFTEPPMSLPVCLALPPISSVSSESCLAIKADNEAAKTTSADEPTFLCLCGGRP